MAGVEVSRAGAVATCRIDSPATRNALSPALLAAVVDCLATLAGDEEVRCIVLAGSDAVFATGANVPAPGTDVSTAADQAGFTEAWRRLEAIEAPIVAAASGWALGSGFELALACDLIVAAKGTRLGLPDITLGVIPSGGATQRLTRTLGRHLTSELVMTGRRIEADEAKRLGLINAVADRRHWLEQATRVAEGIAVGAPLAIRLAKQAIRAADRSGLEEGLDRERELFELTLSSEDRLEGVEAFLQKRPPRFRGR